MRLAFIAGGRGAKNLILSSVMLGHDVSVIENAYDDGKSTGQLRRMFNILGPSDIRKTQQLTMDTRFSELFSMRGDFKNLHSLKEAFRPLPLPRQIRTYFDDFVGAAEAMCKFVDVPPHGFPDFSVVNAVYAGAILAHGNRLSTATESMSKILSISIDVVPSSDDVLWLAGMNESGLVYPDEASIVETRSSIPFNDLFLLGDIRLHEALRSQGVHEAELGEAELLQKLSRRPSLSQDASIAIESADAVVIGPGTLQSSQYPTMMHRGFRRSVAGMPVYVVVNAECDNPMPKYTAERIVSEMIVDYGLDEADVSVLVCDQAEMDYSEAKLHQLASDVIIDSFTKQGRHLGKRVIHAISSRH